MSGIVPEALLQRYSKVIEQPDAGLADQQVVSQIQGAYGPDVVVWKIRRHRRWDLRHFGQRWLEIAVVMPDSLPALRREWGQWNERRGAYSLDDLGAAAAAQDPVFRFEDAFFPPWAETAPAARRAAGGKAAQLPVTDRTDQTAAGLTPAPAPDAAPDTGSAGAHPDPGEDAAIEPAAVADRAPAERARDLAATMAEDLRQELQRSLTYQGVATVYVASLLERAAAQIDPADQWQREQWQQQLLSLIKQDVKLPGAYAFGSRVRRLALVGPTGVGKTTTLAKLAGQLYRLGASFALITVDTYRVGGVQQLAEYAEIMGAPLVVCYQPEEVQAAVRAHRDRDVLLLDTPGRSPHHPDLLTHLPPLLDRFLADEVALVVSCTTKDDDLDLTATVFGELPLTSMIATKADETASLACIYNLARKYQLPLTYLGTGQTVPDDLEVATSRRLLQSILREGGEGRGSSR